MRILVNKLQELEKHYTMRMNTHFSVKDFQVYRKAVNSKTQGIQQRCGIVLYMLKRYTTVQGEKKFGQAYKI
jgi:hypothetical protein